MSNLKLQIEVIPRPLFGKNLRAYVKQSMWDKIRKKVYADNDYRCVICIARRGEGDVTRLFCHEQWEYDDKNHTQRLIGFACTCFMCNLVNHIGFASINPTVRVPMKDVIAHFCQVNNCGLEDFEVHHKEVFAQWRTRNEHEWTQDLGYAVRFLEDMGYTVKVER